MTAETSLIALVDMYRDFGDNLDDDVHPNPKGAQRMAEMYLVL